MSHASIRRVSARACARRMSLHAGGAMRNRRTFTEAQKTEVWLTSRPVNRRLPSSVFAVSKCHPRVAAGERPREASRAARAPALRAVARRQEVFRGLSARRAQPATALAPMPPRDARRDRTSGAGNPTPRERLQHHSSPTWLAFRNRLRVGEPIESDYSGAESVREVDARGRGGTRAAGSRLPLSVHHPFMGRPCADGMAR